MANLATKAGVEGGSGCTIHTPLIELTKAADHPPRARARRRLRAHPSAATTPTPTGRACGHCDSACCAAAGSPRPAWPTRPRYAAGARSRHDLHGQGDLLHAPGRGRPRRAAGRVLPLHRLQPVDRPRGGPRDARSASSATPTSSAPTAPAAASSRPPTSWPTPSPATWPAPADGRTRVRGVHRRRAAAAARRRRWSTRCTPRGFEVAVETNGTLPAARRASTGSASAPRPAPTWCSRAATS